MRRGRPRHDDILTPREWQVLRLIRDGLTNEQIAQRLGISLSAAKYHVSEILSKLDASDRHDAVQRADEHKRGLLALTPLAWLARGHAPKPLLLLTTAVTVAVLGLTLFLAAPWSSGDGDHASLPSDAQLGPDLAPEGLEDYERARLATPYKHTVLLAKTEPQNVGEAAPIIATLPRVASLAELQAVLTNEINLVVIDSNAADEVEGTDFLARQVLIGRAVIELGFCLEQVQFLGPEYPTRQNGGVVTEISPTGEIRQITVDPTNTALQTVCGLPLGKSPEFFNYRRIATPDEIQAARARGENSLGAKGGGRYEFFESVLSELDGGAIAVTPH
jgi:DNA-binding CsgD family transcriptional regulator